MHGQIVAGFLNEPTRNSKGGLTLNLDVRVLPHQTRTQVASNSALSAHFAAVVLHNCDVTIFEARLLKLRSLRVFLDLQPAPWWLDGFMLSPTPTDCDELASKKYFDLFLKIHETVSTRFRI